MMPLLVVTFKFLNLGIDGLIELTLIHDNDGSIFGVVTSREVTLQGLLKNELFLFWHLHVKLEDFMLPLIWLKSHEAQISNIFSWSNKLLRFLGLRSKLRESSTYLKC
jgi:uncharacterized integral membrane protein